MTWTYSGDPSSHDRDKVRFLVGDTDTTDQLVSDEEIAYLLTEAGDPYRAAHDACMAIAAKFTRKAQSKSVGDLSISYADRAAAFREQAAAILRQAGRRDVPTAWVRPDALVRAGDRTTDNGVEFSVGQFDDPSVGE